MYKLIEITQIKYYINSNKTVLYVYDTTRNKIEKIFRDKFSTKEIEVIHFSKGNEQQVIIDLDTIIANNNDFITMVEVISSTIKPKGYFTLTDNYGIKSNYLNEFLGSEIFLQSREENLFQGEDTISLLKEHTPTINILIRNLFHNESDEMIVNFINWLNVVSFKDKNQDIMFLFIGTNGKEEGQGAGKGVLSQLLKTMFSGLVCDVSNTTYINNFNSILANKKIVVFEEVNFKSLKYEHLKDITGSPTLTIEYKGKESFICNNVGSWLGFTNEFDLHNKITIQDRRIFIIRPNPINGSLIRIVNKDFNNNFDYFKEILNSEIDKFIHIISSVEGKVLTPLELVSNAHINYFKEQTKVSILDISNLYKTFIETNFKNKLYEIIDTIIQFDTNLHKVLTDCKTMINLNTINYKIFKLLFNVLQKYDYIPTRNKSNIEWEILKEKLFLHNYKKYIVDTKKTKLYQRFKDTSIIVSNTITKKEQLTINRNYREKFGVLRPIFEIE